MNSVIEKGPITIMLVFSRTCPHCTTYMPIWKDLCNTKGRKANMVSMESDVYQKTKMSQKNPVKGVPSVLYVDKNGQIAEASEPRNKAVMTNAVKVLPGSDLPASVVTSDPKPMSNMKPAKPVMPMANMKPVMPMAPVMNTEPRPLSNAVIPGTMVSDNPLIPVPGTIVQSGGNPWAAFLMAAKQAAPAAMLLGAYAALPARASGLGAPRRTRKLNRRR